MYQQGYDSEMVKRTLEKLKSENFVNDELFAESYLNSEVIRKGRPLMVITQKLEMRGIEKSIITKLVHELDEDIQEGVSE
jgi:regulatory protein